MESRQSIAFLSYTHTRIKSSFEKKTPLRLQDENFTVTKRKFHSLQVLENVDRHWVKCQTEHREGLIPTSHVTPVEGIPKLEDGQSLFMAISDFNPEADGDLHLKRGTLFFRTLIYCVDTDVGMNFVQAVSSSDWKRWRAGTGVAATSSKRAPPSKLPASECFRSISAGRWTRRLT